MEQHPEVPFRIYAHDPEVNNLEFLRFFPNLTKFTANLYFLESHSGLRHLRSDALELGLSETKRPLDLEVLDHFTNLQTLYLSGDHRHPEVLGKLTSLRKLAIASSKLRDLTSLKSLSNLRILELRLGSALDLSPLPEIGKIGYLEIWMMRGLEDLSPIGQMRTLRYLFLQDLPQVKHLPTMDALGELQRVHIEHLRGLDSIAELAKAPALKEVLLVNMRQMSADKMRPLLGHPSLRSIFVGTGSLKRNEEIKRMFGLLETERPDMDALLAD